ncbi:MAG: hypothetical protein K5660_05625 [Paludibacteraceae bacterium]|nr:hypothetical protein [Paludibacteraceae bacterium]
MKKTLFIIASLLLTAYCVADDVVVGNHAKRDKDLQSQAVDPGNGYSFKEGDTIIISKDVKQYLTGEEPSEWVYYVRHIVGQVGGKRFPDGILVQGINSWVGPDGLLLVGATEQTPAAINKQQRDRGKVEKRREELRNMDKQHRDAIEADAKREGATVLNRDEKVRDRDEQVSDRNRQPEQIRQDEVRPVINEPAKQEDTKVVADETEPVQEEDTKVVEEAKDTQAEPDVKRQINRFTIGLRGGVASLLHNTTDNVDGKWKPGFDVLLDLQYAHYWQHGEKPSYGILTGLSAGYVRSAVTAQYANAFTAGAINYNINADAREYDGEVILEVPLMFSMITNSGLYFNVGPRFQLPVFNHFNQSISNDNISALFTNYNVTVGNEVITGKVTEDIREMSGTKQDVSKFNLLLGAELGYEWRLKDNNAFGVGVYASYGLFSLYNHNASGSLLNLTAPTGSTPADVKIFNTTDAYTQGDGFKFGAKNGMNFFDCGIKLNYSFNFVKQ